MKLTWKTSRGHLGPAGDILYLGKKRVGTACEGFSRGKYSAKCLLTSSFDSFGSLDDAKAWVEKSVREWVADAGLTGGDNDPR